MPLEFDLSLPTRSFRHRAPSHLLSILASIHPRIQEIRVVRECSKIRAEREFSILHYSPKEAPFLSFLRIFMSIDPNNMNLFVRYRPFIEENDEIFGMFSRRLSLFSGNAP